MALRRSSRDLSKMLDKRSVAPRQATLFDVTVMGSEHEVALCRNADEPAYGPESAQYLRMLVTLEYPEDRSEPPAAKRTLHTFTGYGATSAV